MTAAPGRLLATVGTQAVLVDVGASAAPPELWRHIAGQAIYVGFDPDLRELREPTSAGFSRAVVVNEAVTPDPASGEATFYFTKSPSCSSTLRPDADALNSFLFADFFTVEDQRPVRAVTLDTVVARLSLPRIDWLKLDSQGTDLRLFNSLPSDMRSRTLALDIEPGLIDAYVGEDLFVDAHKDLTRNGFWLSNLAVPGAVRMKRSTLSRTKNSCTDLSPELVSRVVRPTPAWCEARYFRTLEWLAAGPFTPRDYAVLWSFAMLDGQLGFALDIGVEYDRVFGSDELSQWLKHEPITCMLAKDGRHRRSRSLGGRLVRLLRRLGPSSHQP